MFSKIKGLFEKQDLPEKCIYASVFFDTKDATKEEIFEHIYDTDKYCKWLNLFPILWIKFDKKYQEVGCTGTIYFSLPPFKYRLRVVKVIPNECIELESANGLLKGTGIMKLIQKENGVLYEEPHYLAGINRFVHMYYWKLLAPNHDAFMKKRYEILRKNIAKTRAEKASE